MYIYIYTDVYIYIYIINIYISIYIYMSEENCWPSLPAEPLALNLEAQLETLSPEPRTLRVACKWTYLRGLSTLAQKRTPPSTP